MISLLFVEYVYIWCDLIESLVTCSTFQSIQYVPNWWHHRETQHIAFTFHGICAQLHFSQLTPKVNILSQQNLQTFAA